MQSVAPNYLARVPGTVPPDPSDVGIGGPGGLAEPAVELPGRDGRQRAGRVDEPRATVGHPGGKGVIVAVLDTGVAYPDRGRFRRSPDLSKSRFVRG